jgi:hypothetical protein
MTFSKKLAVSGGVVAPGHFGLLKLDRPSPPGCVGIYASVASGTERNR